MAARKEKRTIARKTKAEEEINESKSEEMVNETTYCGYLTKEREREEKRRVKESNTDSLGCEQKPTRVFIMVEAGGNMKQLRGAVNSFCASVWISCM